MAQGANRMATVGIKDVIRPPRSPIHLSDEEHRQGHPYPYDPMNPASPQQEWQVALHDLHNAWQAYNYAWLRFQAVARRRWPRSGR